MDTRRTIWGDPKGHLAECLPLTVFVHIIPLMRIDGELYDECANGIKSGMYSSTAFRTLQLNAIENVSEIYLNHSIVGWRVLEVNSSSMNSYLNPTGDTEAQLTGASNLGMVLRVWRQVHLEAFFLNMQPKMIRHTSPHFLVRAVSFAPKMRG